jgi:hypothetical protein
MRSHSDVRERLHRGQRGGDDLDMPTHRQRGLRIELMKAARDTCFLL